MLRNFKNSLYKPKKILTTTQNCTETTKTLKQNIFHCTNMWLVNKTGLPTYAAENQLQNEGNLNNMPKI
ncbi:hypothetical protein C0J52_06478 [Blattella germanica]|nr:hypothetical protein C0J52_06478 [Blattella germanica]